MFKKVVGYKILNIHANRAGKEVMMEKSVNELISQGWTPKGALIVDKDGHLYQTMVKVDPNS